MERRIYLECRERIACDPCSVACRAGAIRIEGPISNLPVYDIAKCTGCGACIPVCPGRAVFMVEIDRSEKQAFVSMAHEYYPLPAAGDRVTVVDNKGTVIGKGSVIDVKNPASFDGTPVVKVMVPVKIAGKVRGMRAKKR